MHGYNPRLCNSASTLSNFIERDTPKVNIALPTNMMKNLQREDLAVLTLDEVLTLKL